MKKYMFFLLLLLSGWVFAQERQIIETTTNEDLSGRVATQLQFLFPEFTEGDVFFRNSPKGNGKLNYNMLVGEMQFLDGEEVMALAAKDISMVNINSRKFIPYRGQEFMEEILSTDKGQLCVRRKGNVVPYAKKGAYGTSSSTSSITSYSSISSNDNGQQYNLSIASDVIISVRYFYYLVGTNGKYTQIVNTKSFTKQYPAYRTQIEAFAKEQNIRFDRENDLKRLLEYCSRL